MQTKKEEIEKTILEAAQQEFLLHGYEGASMRTIAKKANTTLGNIYHYFKNKEDILSQLLEETIKGLEQLLAEHLEKEEQATEYLELAEALNDTDAILEKTEMKYLMDERVLILFDLKTTRFVEKKNEFIKAFKQHMAWHLNLNGGYESAYVDILTEMFISCIRHVLMEHKDSESGREEFIRVFRMLCMGLVVNREEDQ